MGASTTWRGLKVVSASTRPPFRLDVNVMPEISALPLGSSERLPQPMTFSLADRAVPLTFWAGVVVSGSDGCCAIDTLQAAIH